MDIGSKLAGYFSLRQNTNKLDKDTSEGAQAEGAVTELLPELTLDMEDSELITLSTKWQGDWNASETKQAFDKYSKENEDYWLGRQYSDYEIESHPLVNNLLFESLEEMLPEATKQEPEASVYADNTPTGIETAGNVQRMLAYQSQRLAVSLKLKTAARFWALYHLGILKIGWSTVTNDITVSAIRPIKMIFDEDGTIDETGTYTGGYAGEVRSDTISDLIERFPDKKDFLTKDVGEQNLGTKVNYTEFWTPTYTFWRYKTEILGKIKNPHWNYDIPPRTQMDEFGNTQEFPWSQTNHFAAPRIPYMFMSVFNLQKHPFDDTGLIQQNIPMQDLANKRIRQIDKNVDSMNNGAIISSDTGITKEQADGVNDAMRRGGAVLLPGNVNESFKRDPAPEMPSQVYEQLNDSRQQLKNTFGTTGLGAAAIAQEQSVRGKILVAQADSSRIGGGISVYLEQMATNLYNWMVQMMYVYYDEQHIASIIGTAKSVEQAVIQQQQLFDVKLTVQVKQGSLIPKDSLTLANQAVDLATAGLLDPITLFERLDFPNPKETAEQLFLWKTNPTMLFPDLQQPPQNPPNQQPLGNQPDMQQQQPPGVQDAQQATPALSAVPINQVSASQPNV